jgi:hypothetical protein
MKCLLSMLLYVVSALAQATPPVEISYDTRPRLELEPRVNLNGAGFQLVSPSITGGAGMEMDRLTWHVYGTYDAAKKAEWTDASSNSNPHGDVRSVGGSVGYRFANGWLIIAQGSYASLHTTLFDKVGWGLGVGAGYDFHHLTCPNCNGSTSARLTLTYGLPLHCAETTTTVAALHCTVPEYDVEQGAQANFTLPSPLEAGRPVWKPYFHAMAFAGVIKTGGQSLTHDGSGSMGLLWRF